MNEAMVRTPQGDGSGTLGINHCEVQYGLGRWLGQTAQEEPFQGLDFGDGGDPGEK